MWHHLSLMPVAQIMRAAFAMDLSVVSLGATLGHGWRISYISSMRVSVARLSLSATGHVIDIVYSTSLDKLLTNGYFSSEYDTQQAIDTLTAIMASSRHHHN